MNTQTSTPKTVFPINASLMALPVAVIFLSLLLAGCMSSVDSSGECSYAADRALIEDLQARYMFALDFGDLDAYVATFAEDGILDIGEGEWQGRDTIKMILESIPQQEDVPSDNDSIKLHPATGRHNFTNIVLKIEGDTAYGRAYWFHMGNNNPERRANLNSYGHYEDVIVKVDGEWLFNKRKIYNEEITKWAAPGENPCW